MGDNKKVDQFKNGEYNDIYLKTDISPIKKYLNDALGINCYLVPRILTKKNGNFDRWCINCYKIQEETQKPLIIIFPEERKFTYDSINLHNTINLNTEIKRNKEKYIHNNEIIELFEELINECKEIARQHKKLLEENL